jgi:hypothetical protein
MKDVVNEEICFDEGNNHFSILASKDCKLMVCAAWEISNYGECNDHECTRQIPIRDLFLFLRDKDKLISEEAKKLSGIKIDELTKLISAFEKNLREKDIIICKQNNKIDAFKTTLRELRKK